MDQEKLNFTAGLTYVLGWLATFVYLIAEDLSTMNKFLMMVIAVPANIFLSTIWPLYWGAIHWLRF